MVMAIELSGFSFDAQSLNLSAETDFIAKISTGLTDKASLLDVIGRKLMFPPYFGNNWDALLDCLRDLSWLQSRRIALIHEDLPQLNPRELRTYLGILSDSIQSWKTGQDHELVVAFPISANQAVAKIALNQSVTVPH